MSLSPAVARGCAVFCMIVMDLTERRHGEERALLERERWHGQREEANRTARAKSSSANGSRSRCATRSCSGRSSGERANSAGRGGGGNRLKDEFLAPCRTSCARRSCHRGLVARPVRAGWIPPPPAVPPSHRSQRPRPDPARRRHPGRVAHRHRQVPHQLGRCGCPTSSNRRRTRSLRRAGQGHPARAGDRPRRRTRMGDASRLQQ